MAEKKQAPKKMPKRPAPPKENPRGTGAVSGGERKPRPSVSESPAERLRREDAQNRRRELRLEAARKRAARRRRQRRLFLLSFALSLVFVLLYWGWVGVSIFTRSDGSENAMPILVYTEGESKQDLRFEAKEVYRNGTYYLPLSVLQEYMAISCFGDSETSSFQLSNQGEYATFRLNTDRAVINGKEVSLKAKSLLIDDMLYLPVDFYAEKMQCFTFTESAPLAAKVLTYHPNATHSFRFQKESEVAPIPFPR